MARMLFKLLSQDPDTLSSVEEASLTRLSATHRRLVIENGRVNTKSEPGFNACTAFIDMLASTSIALGIDPASRSYRCVFTVNYRALFPDGARHYRVDILEASIEQYAAIWVNGDKFEFSVDAMRLAGLLQQSWFQMTGLLERFASSQPRAVWCPLRSELRQALVALDLAWANFEQVYITDLIGIEEKARLIIVQAIENERCLQALEDQHGFGETLMSLSEYSVARTRFVASVGRLNSVANFRRKGRDDLGVEVLVDAVAALQRCGAAARKGEAATALSAAKILATDVVESFEAIRAYLREVEHCLERVDPHLCNNPGLVQRLVDWEESWEVGARYVQHEGMLVAVCDLVAEIHALQTTVPALTKMCEECDVELFMVLPRILWLRFLAKPDCHIGLLQSLLPHRFSDSKACSTVDPSSVDSWHPELQVFYEKFSGTLQLLARAQSSVGIRTLRIKSAETAALDVLVKRAVLGNQEHDDFGEGLSEACIIEARASVEDLVHELERWSIEMQRHCPEDWNQCSAILVQCLTGGDDGPPKVDAFRI